MRISTAAAVLAALVATSASANDLSGFRLEALLGWDHAKLGGVGSESGFAYGVGAGYDFAVGETLSVGVDAEIAESTAKYEVSDGVNRASLSAGRDIYVGGRITGKVAERVALYGKAGYSNARLSLDTTVPGFNDAGNGDGFRLGAGGQYLLGNGAFVGAEYRYSNYEGDFSRHQVLASFGYRF